MVKCWKKVCLLKKRRMPLHCSICNGDFEEDDAFDAHVCPSLSFKLSHKCEICGKTFPAFRGLKRHVAYIHTEKGEYRAQCEICGKVVKGENLRGHFLTHSTDKCFSCHICGASFSRKRLLTIHFRAHSQERKYKCDACGKGFKASSVLNRHVQAVHSKEKPWSCHICARPFACKSVLKNHIRTHTKEQPFQCKVCDRRFAKTNALKVHLRTHTKEKPFKCDACGKTFSHKVCLVRYHRCPKAKVLQEDQANLETTG